MLHRRILLGVSGGVAAYKSAYLARRLVEQGADVQVIMTEAAKRFVGEQTFAAVTGKRVASELFGHVSPHTELARWADGIVIAPATATTMARIAGGLAEDLLSATVLATKPPVLFAPAMHTEMWENPATQRNVETLTRYGHRFVGPASGALAGGDVGEGRMVEPEEIVTALSAMIDPTLEGWRVLVTAGGTREPIDPVRYIGNRSTGKMGYAIADAAARRGADVTLVTTSSLVPPSGAKVVAVETAQQMADAVLLEAPTQDVIVMAAAVADFKPGAPSGTKLRRADGPPELDLSPTVDILGSLGKLAKRPYLVGFAAEAGPAAHAVDKASRADLTVANDVTAAGSGFATDTNQVTIFENDGPADSWPLMSKTDVAARLWDTIRERTTPGH
jgi:phosphopantothenoylcysteine decarboxylase / phosphopantothenate---cysteine ligase